MRILVVSNDARVQPLVESAIFAEDRAAFLSKPDERVDLAHEQPCDLILLDRDVPEHVELLARLSENKRTMKIPIVILSTAEPSQNSEVDPGAGGWIRKPFSVDELRCVLSRFRNRLAPAPPTEDQDLRDEYLRDCRVRISRTGRLLSLLEISPNNKELLQELRTEIHKIAGSAGTFGFPEASRLATVVERELDLLVDRGELPTMADLSRWRRTRKEIEDQLFPGEREMVRSGSVVPLALCIGGREGALPLLENALVAEGWDVVMVGPEQVSTQFGSTSPDLVLIDGAIGFATARKIILSLQSTGSRERMFLMMIETGSREDDADAVDSGVDALLRPPVELELLLPVLRHRLDVSQGKSSSVLLLEDGSAASDLLRTVLGSAGNEVTAEGYSTEHVLRLKPDVVVVAPAFERHERARFFRQIRANDSLLSLPIVNLLPEEVPDPASYSSPPEMGVDDLAMPVSPARLIRIVAARAERHRLARRLLERDRLTDLLTPAYFRQMAAGVSHDDRYRAAMIEFQLDQDPDDSVNRYRKELSLLRIARVLRSHMREYDLAVRLGPQRLGSLVLNIDLHDARRLAEKLKSRYGQFEEGQPSSLPITVTVVPAS